MRNCVKQADLGDQLIRKNRNFDIIPAEVKQLQEIYDDRGPPGLKNTVLLTEARLDGKRFQLWRKVVHLPFQYNGTGEKNQSVF